MEPLEYDKLLLVVEFISRRGDRAEGKGKDTTLIVLSPPAVSAALGLGFLYM